MWKTLTEKLLKSELWVSLVAIFASALSGKLGLPEEAVATFIMSVTGLAVVYVGGRSYTKPKELDAAGRAASLVVPLPKPPTL